MKLWFFNCNLVFKWVSSTSSDGGIIFATVADAVIGTFDGFDLTGIGAVAAVAVADAAFGTSDGFDSTGIGAGRTAI